MCGIFGILNKNGLSSDFSNEELLKVMHHRGPDANGIFRNNEILFGHNRLSILDLSNNGAQPMFSHDGRYVMVYNGEVYNFKEIANEIKLQFYNNSANYILKSSSDSEVIIEAFRHYGPDFVQKLNGMFSIAIYDLQLHTLFLYRDRLGIKPLYYYFHNNTFFFSSELKLIREAVKNALEVSPEAVQYYLNLGFIPAPLTIYKDVKKLEPGTSLVLQNLEHIKLQHYWSVENAVSKEIVTDKTHALVRLSDLLMSSVQYQLLSDVPVGVFLSGGIDSSFITAQAVNLSGTKISTFSIGFEENKFNEADYARKIANYLGTNHNEFIVPYKTAISLIDDIIDVYDEPFADSSSIPTMLVSQLARKQVTVALSGEGGDELFYGYGSYKWANILNKTAVKMGKPIVHSMLKRMNNKYKRAANLFLDPKPGTIQSHIFSQEQYLFSARECEQLMSKELMFNLFNNFDIKNTSPLRKLTAVEKQAMFDLNYYLPGDLLTKVDRASMRYSLETRVPFLDHRIVEFAINLSPELKLNGTTKYILKELLYQHIPKHFFDRPKQGFAIPLSTWLKKDLSYLIDEYLSQAMVKKFNVLNADIVKQLITDYKNGKDYLYNRIWNLIVLQKWLAKHYKTSVV